MKTSGKNVRKSDLPGLDYITAGPVPPNPAELAFSNRVDEIFEELEDNYDVIIVDTPPIGIVTDALMNLHRQIIRYMYLKRSI